jgi:hypothetical protein
MAEWRRARNGIDYKYQWWADSVGINCPCGEMVVVMDEPVACDCGREYQLIQYLEVKEKE